MDEPFCFKGLLDRLDFIVYRIALIDDGWQVTFQSPEGRFRPATSFGIAAKSFFCMKALKFMQ